MLFPGSANASLRYLYKKEKIYYYDDGRSEDNTGVGYFVAAFAGLANTPAILGVLVGGATISDYLVDNEFDDFGLIGGGVAVTEICLQLLADKTPSYIINGAIAALPFVVFPFLDHKKLEYPPKKILISLDIFWREDISLDYDTSRRVYADLRRKKILTSRYESPLSDTYSPTKNIELTGQSKAISDHVNWVLREVYSYNKTGTSNAIVFGSPSVIESRDLLPSSVEFKSVSTKNIERKSVQIP